MESGSTERGSKCVRSSASVQLHDVIWNNEPGRSSLATVKAVHAPRRARGNVGAVLCSTLLGIVRVQTDGIIRPAAKLYNESIYE